MKTVHKTPRATTLGMATAMLLLLAVCLAPRASAGPDPAFSFYGYQEIVPDPNPAIVGENTHITVTVSNPGDADATNVDVKLSFNDWGVTFMGWQEIGTASVALIPAGGQADVEFDYVFSNRTHTCLEALIVSADLDDEDGNNRGQINLEVVNAGESFEFYVPVVNNGDEDLFVGIHGHCRPADPAGIPDLAVCVPIDEEVVVPAGERVLVPVLVEFLPGAPRGTPVDVVIDAFDLLSPDPGSAAHRNHVVVRVVFNTARGLKEDCVAALAALPPPGPVGAGSPSAKAAEKRLSEVLRHINRSLDPDLWEDDSRLAAHAGASVYAQEMAAILHALKLVNRPELPLEWKRRLDACARDLADAERILAQTVIADAGGDPAAEELLLEGDALRLAGDYAGAVRTYGQILK